MVARNHTSSEWLSPADLAARWGISEAVARRHIHAKDDAGDPVPAGKLPGFRVARARLLRVHISDVEAHEARKAHGETVKGLRAVLGRTPAYAGKDYFGDL